MRSRAFCGTRLLLAADRKLQPGDWITVVDGNVIDAEWTQQEALAQSGGAVSLNE